MHRFVRIRLRRAVSTKCVGFSLLMYVTLELGLTLLASDYFRKLVVDLPRRFSDTGDFRNSVHENAFPESNNDTFQAELVRDARRSANCQHQDNPKAGYVICDRLPFTRITCGRLTPGEWEPPVPNIVHFIWLGEPFEMKHFHQYLALRSVASLQRPVAIYFHHGHGNDITMTDLWRRVLDEIPCVRVIQADPPSSAFGQPLKNPTAQSDFYRLLLLRKHGGTYLDLDVITLKPFDWLRNFRVTLGRSLVNKISNGIILSQPGAHFLDRWIDSYVNLDKIRYKPFSYWGLVVPYELYETSPRGQVHLELTSMNRPNPFQDGLNATTSDRYDLSQNYFLHVHPQVFPLTGNQRLYDARERLVRTMDDTYGSAARVALFGSPDLVFLKGETPFSRMPVKSLDDLAPPDGESSDEGGLLSRLWNFFQH